MQNTHPDIIIIFMLVDYKSSIFIIVCMRKLYTFFCTNTNYLFISLTVRQL